MLSSGTEGRQCFFFELKSVSKMDNLTSYVDFKLMLLSTYVSFVVFHFIKMKNSLVVPIY